MKLDDVSDGQHDVDCQGDPIGSLVTMFVDMVQKGRIAKGQCPARRPVFLKLHGAARARVRIRPDLPKHLRVGLFQPGCEYDAWMRFSSDTLPTISDYGTTAGIGLKLFDTPGPKVFGDPEANTSDLIFQNMDRFFVDTATDMCEFTKAGVVDRDYDAYLNKHKKTADILDKMAHPVGSLLAIDYWAILPFHLGPTQFVKYRLEPTITVAPPASKPADPTYLAADLQERLDASDARFVLSVQVRTDPDTMPLDEATVLWHSPFVQVADIVIPRQDISHRGQSEYAENLSFNIFRVSEDHAPAAESSIAAARGAVYAASAQQRRDVNGTPDGEPEHPKPVSEDYPVTDTRIVRAAIHPAIGVARVGDAETEYFIGPQTLDPPPADPGFYRDAEHALKRQAAQFRVYGYNAAGEVVSELTDDNATITWRVEVANRKAAWYRFVTALDLPETADLQVPRRNPKVKVTDSARDKLAITPEAVEVSGPLASSPELVGTFGSTEVSLGELRTDAAGRLQFLGGHGVSGSPSGAPLFDPDDPDSFNNADDWFDDMSDGPVDATVTIGGRPVPVEGAWVIVAPPNYAPDVLAWRTLYDLLVDAYIQAGWMSMPAQTSFTKDILPALRRLSNLQWVNAGFFAMFGRGRPFDFENPDLIARLAAAPRDGNDPYAELRLQVVNAFRPADAEFSDPRIWPWIYGDDFGGELDAASPRTMLAIPLTLGRHLARWAKGDFLADWSDTAPHPDPSAQPDADPPPDPLVAVPLADQPAMLDRAALDNCLADAFHPGCELTWPIRHLTMFTAPFRIRRRAGGSEPDYGKQLNARIATSLDGPLYGQVPGGLTRWMALPWQGDTAYCRSGYDPEYDPYLPTFWPARVPNQVITQEDYEVVIDESRPREERLSAYTRRASWYRAIDAGQPPIAERMERMVAHFGAQGLVESRPGVKDDPDFPPVILVESVPPKRLLAAAAPLPEPTTDRERLLQLAGWGDEEHLAQARRLRSRGR